MPAVHPGLRPLSLDLSPLEVAAGLRHLPGLVFLDSALAGRGSFSIVAAKPALLLEKTELAGIESALSGRRRASSDLGYPTGAAIGLIEYEGAASFGFYDEILVFDHHSQSWLGSVGLADQIEIHPPTSSGEPLRFESLVDRLEYCRRVVAAQKYITAGHIYQVNIARPFTAKWNGDAFTFFQALRHYSPAPYSAFLDVGGRQIVSSSPECFLQISGRQITTRPIKGTRPRRADPERDELSAYELLTSPKEIAELVMITDLERNDLGQICEYGRVQVTELLKLERFEQVFHLVSTVKGVLSREISQVQALAACFPGGSITGAPKKRAREIIWELEQRPRGVYTGAIGYFGYNEESQFNIAIRTVCFENGCVEFQTGAGIVADSQPEMEWQETLDKAAGILLAGERLLEE